MLFWRALCIIIFFISGGIAQANIVESYHFEGHKSFIGASSYTLPKQTQCEALLKPNAQPAAAELQKAIAEFRQGTKDSDRDTLHVLADFLIAKGFSYGDFLQLRLSALQAREAGKGEDFKKFWTLSNQLAETEIQNWLPMGLPESGIRAIIADTGLIRGLQFNDETALFYFFDMSATRKLFLDYGMDAISIRSPHYRQHGDMRDLYLDTLEHLAEEGVLTSLEVYGDQAVANLNTRPRLKRKLKIQIINNAELATE